MQQGGQLYHPMKHHMLKTVQHARPVVQPGSSQDRREARLADLRRGGGRVPGRGGPRRAAPQPLPLPTSMTGPPRPQAALPPPSHLGVVWPHPVSSPPPLLRQRPQRAASPAALSPAGSLADETVRLPATSTSPADAADSSEAQAQPHRVLARHLREPHLPGHETGSTAEVDMSSSNDDDNEAASNGEDDGAAVNACKALLYAAANAVLFGVARLLHGTFTSY